MKIDVLIVTKDPSKVRPKLMEALNAAPWVNRIIFETSKPLATARVIGLNKCTTEWVAMFDDDVEIPCDWFERVTAPLGDGVIAVSAPDMTQDEDFYYHQVLVDMLVGLEGRDTPYIDNLLIKKEAMAGYDPPPAFYCEDEFFYDYAQTKGKWVHTKNIGVKHFYIEKDSLYNGASQRIYKFEPAINLLRRAAVRFLLAPFVAAYTGKLSTMVRWYRINIRLIAGWAIANSLKGCIATPCDMPKRKGSL